MTSVAAVASTEQGPADLRVRRGCTILIVGIVAAQFIDLNFGTVAGFVLSAQKLIAVIAIPVGLLLVGRLKFEPLLVAVGGLFGLMLVSGWLFGGRGVPDLPSYLLAMFFSVLAAFALSTAVSSTADGFAVFGRAWVIIATISASLTVAQFAGIAPLFAVDPTMLDSRVAIGSFNRGTGLKFDPNFQAIMLCIGLALIPVARVKRRGLCTAILVIGIVATLSRMGIGIGLVFLVLTLNITKIRGRDVLSNFARVLAAVGALGAIGFALLAITPDEIRSYAGDRIGDVAAMFGVGEARSSVNDSSAQERLELLKGGVGLTGSAFPTGVGAGMVPAELHARGLPAKAVHNTYIEAVAVGGIFGLAVISSYLVAGLRASTSRELFRSYDERTALRWVLLMSAVVAGLITLVYNSFFWIPLALVAALWSRHRALRTEEDLRRRPSTWAVDSAAS